MRWVVYGAGEAIDGRAGLERHIAAQLARLASVATNRAVAALAQLDATTMPSMRVLLDPAGRFPPEAIGAVNTGDPEALVDFVRWAATTCPAERTVLVLSGHGLAWSDDLAGQVVGATRARALGLPPNGRRHARRLFGAGRTPSDEVARAVLLDGGDRDFLSNLELAIACERSAQVLGAPIDTLVFDACLMSSWELLGELAPSVHAVVASIDELSSDGIDLASPAWRASVQGGVLGGAEMAATIASGFAPRTPFDTCVAIDLTLPAWSAATGHLRAAVDVLLPWAQASADRREVVRGALRRAAASAVKFTSGGLADVGALARAFAGTAALPPGPAEQLGAASSALASCVVGRALGAGYREAIGLSIYAPPGEAIHGSNRAVYRRLQVPAATRWAALLDVLFGFAPLPS